MIVILTGARKNVGDYLIGSRAKKLLARYVDEDIQEFDRFESQEENLEVINTSKALFLCGGPAYAENIYPGIYRLTRDLKQIQVPVVPLGLGWSGKPPDHPELFRFDQPSQAFLQWVHDRIETSSCRDEITLGLLAQQGIHNVTMTGCPVWYDLNSLGTEFCHSRFERIVFTTPASRLLVKQNRNVMRELRNRFPKTEIVCSFHRGIFPDRETRIRHALAYLRMTVDARKLGFKVVDASYSLSKIDFYRYFDLHVGYRVHAHLDFLSRRKPSILINEDGRGIGMNRSLELPELNCGDRDLLESFKQVLDRYQSLNFQDFVKCSWIIDNTFNKMRDFLVKFA